MAWYDKYFGGSSGSSGSSSSSSSSSNQGDDNKGGGSDASSNSFGNSFTGNQGNPSEAGGSTVVNNNNDYNTSNTTSVPKQNNPYLYGGTTSKDLADVGFTGVGNPSTEKRQETSGYNPNDNQGGTMTETSNDGTVTTTTNVLGDNPNTTVTTPDNNNETETKTEGEGEDNLLNTLFGDENTTGLDDDAKKNTTPEEKRALVLKFKAQSGYDQLPTSLRNQADEIIARINAGEYFGSDFANMQGTTQSGNQILAGNNKSTKDISKQDALNLFRIATQNKNAGTAREAGFSTTAEALLKSYVDTLSPADRAAFQEEARKIQDAKFTDPRNNMMNMYRDPALLKRLTGLSSLNTNQLDYDQFVNEAQRVRDSRSDNNTGQVNTFTSSQMGTDNVAETTTAPNYGSSIDNPHSTKDFIDSDGDGVDDRYQKGPGQPYMGPDLDPNKTDVPTTDVTTAQQANPNSFGGVALQGVYNLIPVKDRFTGKIRYIRQPVSSFGGIYT